MISGYFEAILIYLLTYFVWMVPLILDNNSMTTTRFLYVFLTGNACYIWVTGYLNWLLPGFSLSFPMVVPFICSSVAFFQFFINEVKFFKYPEEVRNVRQLRISLG